jgi:hypothetical protein
MKILQVLFLLCLSFSFFGCNIQDFRNKTEKIERITMAQCKCDDVRLINYTEENFRTYVELEVVGSGNFSKREIATKINEALKDSVTDYCKIDEFMLDFIDNGNHELLTIRYCKIDE